MYIFKVSKHQSREKKVLNFLNRLPLEKKITNAVKHININQSRGRVREVLSDVGLHVEAAWNTASVVQQPEEMQRRISPMGDSVGHRVSFNTSVENQ